MRIRNTPVAIAAGAFICNVALAGEIGVEVRDLQGNSLSDAVVFAQPVAGPLAAIGPAPHATIDQVSKQFVPRVTVLRAGTEVTFPNSDNIRHSVYSFSPAKVFTTKLYAGRQAAPITFDKSGVVVLGCNIHDQMLAWVVIVDTPYFAKSGVDGVASLKELPAGEYRLNTWYPGLDAAHRRDRDHCGRWTRTPAGAHRCVRLAAAADAVMIRIHHLRTRIIVLFVALLTLVQIAGFFLVNAANSRNALAKVEEELAVGQRVFERLLAQNAEKLSQTARVLAADFPFREAVATHDVGTLASVLANHGARIDADVMLFVDLDGRVVADTLRPDAASRGFEYPELLKTSGVANAGLQILDGRAFQMVAVPVLAPLPIGWVVVGYAVDDDLARDLRRLTTLEVSFYRHDDARGWQVLASTLDPAAQRSLSSGMPHWSRSTATHVVAISGDEHQARVIPLGTNGDVRIVAVLHRSLAGALAAFDRLRNTLVRPAPS